MQKAVSTRLVLGIALVFGLLLGFGTTTCGFRWFSEDRNTENILAKDFNSPGSGTTRIGAQNFTISTKSELTELPDRITNLTIPTQLFHQKAAIASWTSILTQDQLLDWLEQSIHKDWQVSTFFRTEFQKAMVERLSQRSPKLALEFALDRFEPVRSSLGSIVFFNWAVKDLNGAIEAAKSLDLLDRYWALRSIFESQDGLATEQQQEIARALGDETYALTFYFQSLLAEGIEDPENVWFEVLELAVPNNRHHETILEAVATAWIHQAGLEVFNEICSSIKDRSTKNSVALGVLLDFADVPEQTAEAFEYVFSQNDEFPWKEPILNSIIWRWAKYDPDAVLRRAITLPPSHFKESMIEDVYHGRALNDPKSILSNLNTVPRQHQVYIGKIAVRALSESSPSDAVNLVLQIDEKRLQHAVGVALVHHWAKLDLKDMKTWVLSLPENEPLRDTLVASISHLFVDSDPE